MNYKTDQEDFWAGDFGNQYLERNADKQLVASNIHFLSSALSKASKLNSCIEFGSNIGNNLTALKYLVPDIELNAIEINPKAKKKLEKFIPNENIFEGSILDFEPSRKYDLVLIKGVLIHLNPKYLNDVYLKLFNSTSKYILLAEYYNPTPVEIEYRGHKNKLFKRDFAGEILENYRELSLLDYGFCYHGDKLFPNADITWFLLEKNRE